MANPAASPLRVSALSSSRPTPFDLRPDAQASDDLKTELGLIALRKVSFVGTIKAEGDDGWRLNGHLGATVVQPCVVTLDPVTTRIEEDATRLFLPAPDDWDTAEEDEEVEMPDDDSIEPLGTHIDLSAILTEVLALSLPAYPRSDGASLDQTTFAEPGTQALSDDDVKPFAGLKALRDKLQDGD